MTTVTASSPAPATIDVSRLYRLLNRRLQSIVSTQVQAPDQLIEDACQNAWSRLVRHADRVEPVAVTSWLVATARRDAVKQLDRTACEVSLDELREAGDPALLRRPAPTIDQLCAQRERLRTVEKLPRREQRVVWLHAAGLSYVEVADATGESRRSVERQLQRGRRRLRAMAA